MSYLEELLCKVRRSNHQGMPLTNFFVVLKEYRPLGQYMLKKFGWKSWYSFWFTKLFVADEGGEYALLNRFYRHFPRLLGSPFKIEIEHTTICDKECMFCEHTHWAEKKQRISIAQVKKIVDSLPNLQWINLAGEGSNFLNKDFRLIVSYLRERHINVNFVDEFDFLDEEKARFIIEQGVNSLYVSFDASTKSTYERIKKGCDFDNALLNIKRLLQLKEEMNSPLPVLHFRFIVSTVNYHEMPEYINLIASLKNRGARGRIEFIGLLTFPGIESYYIAFENIPRSIMIETMQNALKHNINLYFTHAGAGLPSMNRCAAWLEPFILINGDVISCCAFNMANRRKFLVDNSFGNAYSTPFIDIWRSENYRNFRKSVNTKYAKVPKTCYGCRAYDTRERAILYGIEEQPISPDRDMA